MNIAFNRQQDGFAERIPNGMPSDRPFRLGQTVRPAVGDRIFVEPGEHEAVNARLAEYYGLRIGDWIAYRKYLVEVAT